MKVRDYLLKEVVNTVAYWLSPKGEVIAVESNHIDAVIKDPYKFGLTAKYISDLYDKHGEELGQEGKAREQIIIDLVKKGWIRVRRYRNDGYSVNIARMTKQVKDILFDWVDKLTTKGILGAKEKDLYIPLNILGFVDGTSRSITLKDIQKGLLYEGDEVFDKENSIYICED